MARYEVSPRDRGNDEGVGVFFKQSRMAKSKFDRCIDWISIRILGCGLKIYEYKQAPLPHQHHLTRLGKNRT